MGIQGTKGGTRDTGDTRETGETGGAGDTGGYWGDTLLGITLERGRKGASNKLTLP